MAIPGHVFILELAEDLVPVPSTPGPRRT